jgi:hypothetical protein
MPSQLCHLRNLQAGATPFITSLLPLRIVPRVFTPFPGRWKPTWRFSSPRGCAVCWRRPCWIMCGFAVGRCGELSCVFWCNRWIVRAATIGHCGGGVSRRCKLFRGVLSRWFYPGGVSAEGKQRCEVGDRESVRDAGATHDDGRMSVSLSGQCWRNAFCVGGVFVADEFCGPTVSERLWSLQYFHSLVWIFLSHV